MSLQDTEPVDQSDKILKLRDLVFFNIVSVIGIPLISLVAIGGPGTLTLWLLAVILFFVPYTVAIIKLSSKFENRGGIYDWTKQVFGEKHGFLCGWYYWINTLLLAPTVLIATVSIATYAFFGKGEVNLKEYWYYVIPLTLLGLWLAAILNIVGLKTGKWLQNVGAMGTYIPGVFLIALAVYAILARKPAANSFTLETLKPSVTTWASTWSTIAYAIAGLELSSAMGGHIQNQKRNLPRSIYISAPLIAFIYIFGTGALLWLQSTKTIYETIGLFQGISTGLKYITDSLWWILPLVAAFSIVGRIGGMGAWLTGPAHMASAIGLDGYFPPAFRYRHPRWGTPYVAILFQTVLGTIFLLVAVLGKDTAIDEAYHVLLDTMIIVSFIPYLYLFACFLNLGEHASDATKNVTANGRSYGILVLGLSGLLVTLSVMTLAMIHDRGSKISVWKVVGGSGILILSGGILYWHAKKKQQRDDAAKT